MDYGEKNIGLACSDELGLTVQPLPSLPNLGKKDFIKRIESTVIAMDIRELVLGVPYNMDGSQGDAVLRMQSMMKFLKSSLNMPLFGVDERLSTVEALELWREMTPRKKKKYRTVDSLAAAFILERYLRES